MCNGKGLEAEYFRQMPTKRLVLRQLPSSDQFMAYLGLVIQRILRNPGSVTQKSRSFILLKRFSDGEFNVAEKMENLYFEAVHPNGQSTAATAVRMDLLDFFLYVIVLQGVDKME